MSESAQCWNWNLSRSDNRSATKARPAAREIRSSKSELRTDAARHLLRNSVFGLRSSFGLRLAAFGFPPHVTAVTHRKDAVYPATIVGIPPMEDFYIGGAALIRPVGHPLPSDGRGAGGESAR